MGVGVRLGKDGRSGVSEVLELVLANVAEVAGHDRVDGLLLREDGIDLRGRVRSGTRARCRDSSAGPERCRPRT
jgi:hypothetical protein